MRLIPVTSFAGKTVAVFGLGGSGLASCHALKAGGAEVIAGDDSADNIVKASASGLHHRGFAKSIVGEFRRAGADAGRAAHPSGAALDRAGGAAGRH